MVIIIDASPTTTEYWEECNIQYEKWNATYSMNDVRVTSREKLAVKFRVGDIIRVGLDPIRYTVTGTQQLETYTINGCIGTNPLRISAPSYATIYKLHDATHP